MNMEFCMAILDSIRHPIVFVDTDHIIRYLNKAARVRYYEKRGYAEMMGKSIFDCHNSSSGNQIQQLYKRLEDGEDEIFLKINKDQEKVTLVSVRDSEGKLLGYYERFEKKDA